MAVSASDRQVNVERLISSLEVKAKRNPQDAATHYALAHAYFTSRQFSKGESELQRVLDLQPQNTSALMDLAAAYLREDRSKDAQDEFTKLLAIEPNSARGSHYGMGPRHGWPGKSWRVPSPSTRLPSASSRNPAKSIIWMGLSQTQLKKYDEAIASFFEGTRH